MKYEKEVSATFELGFNEKTTFEHLSKAYAISEAPEDAEIFLTTRMNAIGKTYPVIILHWVAEKGESLYE